jgi:hypothetical protein
MVLSVAFCGLPSGGKSSAVNSLAGKRAQATGVARTTTEQHCFPISTVSDDGVEFTLMDLPGVSDGEDTSKDFDDITTKAIAGCDVIFWVTSAMTAMLTSTERAAFQRVLDAVKTSKTKGIHQRVGMLFTKMDELFVPEVIEVGPSEAIDPVTAPVITGGELMDDGGEDSTVADNVRRAIAAFPGVAWQVFNAHGRSIHHDNSSNTLRKFVKKLNPHASSHNREFHLQWAHDTWKEDVSATAFACMNAAYSNFCNMNKWYENAFPAPVPENLLLQLAPYIKLWDRLNPASQYRFVSLINPTKPGRKFINGGAADELVNDVYCVAFAANIRSSAMTRTHMRGTWQARIEFPFGPLPHKINQADHNAADHEADHRIRFALRTVLLLGRHTLRGMKLWYRLNVTDRNRDGNFVVSKMETLPTEPLFQASQTTPDVLLHPKFRCAVNRIRQHQFGWDTSQAETDGICARAYAHAQWKRALPHGTFTNQSSYGEKAPHGVTNVFDYDWIAANVVDPAVAACGKRFERRCKRRYIELEKDCDDSVASDSNSDFASN